MLNFQETLKIDHSPEATEAKSAFQRILKGLPAVVALVLIVAVAGTMFFLSNLVSPCEYIHREGTIMDDGTIRYIQGEYQYLSMDELGLDQSEYTPGDRIELCFDTATDEFIQTCSYTDRGTISDTSLAWFLSGTLALAVSIVVIYWLICRFSSFGNAYYQYLKAYRQKEKEQEAVPPKVRFVTAAVSLTLACLLCAPWIASLVDNIQREQRIKDRADLIHGVEDSANELSDALDGLNDKLNSTATNDAVDHAGEAAGNIGDILDELNGNAGEED